MAYVPSESTIEQIKKYCKNKPNLTLTVGVLEDGERTYMTYNGEGELVNTENGEKRLYEIGSITKPFTAALFTKMVSDGVVGSHESIGKYIGARSDAGYPTLDRLASHVSGLGRAPISTSKLLFKAIFGKGKLANIYSGFDGKKMEKHLRGLNLEPTDYPTQYTHYGFGALGYVLGKADGRGYKAAITDLLRNDLGLENTHFCMPDGACDGGYSVKNEKIPCWTWSESDAMAGSDCLTSCAEDLLKFAELCLSGKYEWLNSCLEPRAQYDDTDDFGFGFIARATNKVVWHNGSTGCFAAFLAFDRESGRAVTVLSDYEHVKGEFSIDRIGFSVVQPKNSEPHETVEPDEDADYDDYEPYQGE